MDLISFVVTYFVTKNLRMMTAFICWPPEQITELWRSANVVGLRLTVYTDLYRPPRMMPYARHREAMMVDMQCDGVPYLLLNVSSVRAFNYRHSWLLLHNSSYDRHIIEDALKDYEILPDADVTWAAPDALTDVYRVKDKHPLLLTRLGVARNCTKEELIRLWSILQTTPKRRKDLRNIMIPAISALSTPQFTKGWYDITSRHIDPLPKFSYPLLQLMREDLNMRYNMRQVDLYGTRMSNGSFDGLVGVLQRREAELGFTAMFMREDRMEVSHYFSETTPFTLAIIFRQPARSTVSNVFLAPFTTAVWTAFGLVALLAAALLMLLKTVLQTWGIRQQESRQLLSSLTLLDTCTFAVGSLCQQGFHLTPPVSSIRVVMFSTLLSALFVFTAYSAKIVALLQMPSDAIRTIDDLTKSRLTVGVRESVYKKVYFLETNDKSSQELYRRKIEPQGEGAYHDIDKGIAFVRTGMYAFQVERSAGYDVISKTFTEREKCSLHELEAFKMPMTAIPMKRYSGYRELFASRMRWQREVGLMDRSRRKWMAAKPKCEAKTGGFVSIGITDVLPAIQSLGIGLLLAVILLCAELLVHSVMRGVHRLPRRARHYSGAMTASIVRGFK